MALLLNPKHEAFAQAVAAGCGLLDAYERAGFVRAYGNPNRLARRPKVAARIAELQSQISPADLVNIEYIQAKVIALNAEILGAATDRDALARIANDLHHLAEALNLQASEIGVPRLSADIPKSEPVNLGFGRQTPAEMPATSAHSGYSETAECFR